MIKKEYHHGHLKEEFIRIALEFIAKEDVDKLTLKVLSDSTGTSRSAIYKHFKNKDALIEKVIEHGFEMFDKETTTILKDNAFTLVDKFFLTGKLYIEFARKNSNLYRLLFGKKYAHIREGIVSIKDDDCSGFAELKKVIEEGQKKGILKDNDSYKQTIVIWSSMHGFSSLVIDGFMDVETVYEDIYINLFETLLAGILVNQIQSINKLIVS